MQLILIACGLLVLILVLMDFFHTTLSGNGFWFISKGVNSFLSKLILANKSRFICHYSGLFHLMFTTLAWLLLLLLGSFIIFSSGGNMVVDSETNLPATMLERFYYTCYVVSTLGLGGLEPGNNTSRIFTGILSYSGFILLTTALTYFVSVIKVVLQKKQLAFYISTLGEDIGELYHFFVAGKNLNPLDSNTSDLRKMIIQNSSNYVFFPIIQHFLTWRENYSVEVQLARFYEVLMVLKIDLNDDDPVLLKINSLLSAIQFYLDLGLEKPEDFEMDNENISRLRNYWNRYGHEYQNNAERDKALDASLKSAGWSWRDVYEEKA